ncbi:3989_t:CDS:2 [Funneliformis geosporum]|uniref:Inositol oxygenase n=1 Tax=Funneliformis geosporum TaxID=1117311 RepID=A0A9W4SS22_9GLOM|nr:3989_t:CDS:2 [Funneliformis geosporum]CAI2179466.1 11425_t:CDS:2 [Funneliformis geosporum]
MSQIHLSQSSFEETCEELDTLLLSRYSSTSIDNPTSSSSSSPTSSPNSSASSFRAYTSPKIPTRIIEFYKEQHEKQTVSNVIEKRSKFSLLNNAKLCVWEALELLNTLVDNSDPDTQLSQIEHCLQTAESLRKDGQPRWLILTGLIHDLGKLLFFYGAEGQWDVVGDTFPVGCRFSPSIIFPEFFKNNPDYNNPKYNTLYGIYEPNCGLDNVLMSYGHDEYMYQVVKNYLPAEASYIIRYHSFYAQHRENAYTHLMNETDHEMMKCVKIFNPYDLYSKSDQSPNVQELKPYYLELIREYFPEKICW